MPAPHLFPFSHPSFFSLIFMYCCCCCCCFGLPLCQHHCRPLFHSHSILFSLFFFLLHLGFLLQPSPTFLFSLTERLQAPAVQTVCWRKAYSQSAPSIPQHPLPPPPPPHIQTALPVALTIIIGGSPFFPTIAEAASLGQLLFPFLLQLSWSPEGQMAASHFHHMKMTHWVFTARKV